MSASLLFPQTVVFGSTLGALWPLCEPIQVLEPFGLPAGAAPPCALPDLAQVIPPPGDQRPDADLMRQLNQWREWFVNHQGSGQAAALKAGVAQGEDPETLAAIRKEIRKYGQGGDQPPAGPATSPELVLLLAHLKDAQEAEMEGILAQVDASGQALGAVMGLEAGDADPGDYRRPLFSGAPPLEYRIAEEDSQMARRLAAWAGLWRSLDLTGGWLATGSRETASLLLERANAVLDPGGRSPAGASYLAPDFSGRPRAQEAARLVVPDLSGLGAQALNELAEGLAGDGVLAELRQRLDALLGRLAGEAWGRGLAGAAADEAKAIAQGLGFVLSDRGVVFGGHRSLSLLVFPGYDRAGLAGLMAGQASAPAGEAAYPVIAVW